MNSEPKVLRQPPGAEVKQSETHALLGDFGALLRRVGAAGEPQCFAGHLVESHTTETSWTEFLAAYQANVLVPVELPTIARAASHAACGQWRELLALDGQLAQDPRLRPFANGSQQVCRLQLERFRPTRDRVAGRYLAAVEEGKAHGWHTIAYGVVLAAYSVPLRQGLIHYARETMSGLADLGPNRSDAASIETLLASVPAAVEQILAPRDQAISIASP